MSWFVRALLGFSVFSILAVVAPEAEAKTCCCKNVRHYASAKRPRANYRLATRNAYRPVRQLVQITEITEITYVTGGGLAPPPAYDITGAQPQQPAYGFAAPPEAMSYYGAGTSYRPTAWGW